MSSEQYQDWIDYYRQRGARGGDLKDISGYTHGLAQLTQAGLADITDTARQFLGLTTEDSLLDVGCGAGLLTQYLVRDVRLIVGLDASREMMVNATRPGFQRIEAVADHLPFDDNTFDKIFCHSIFQYFPDQEYAARVIAEMRRVLRPGGRALIMDVPDDNKKEDYIKVKTPDTHNLNRIFYERGWLANLGPNISIFERAIRNYGNSQFRFNVLIER